MTDPGIRTTETEYDTRGRRVEVTLPDDSTTTTSYDYAGNVSQRTGSQTYKVGYTYDRQGRRTTMEVKNGPFPGTLRTTTWSYDAGRGWLEEKEDAAGESVTYTYTDAGRLETRTWARGVVTTYGYNAAGDLETTDYSDSTPDVHRTYTRLGQLDVVKDGTLSGGTIASPRYTHTYAYHATYPRRLVLEIVAGVHPASKVLTRLYEPGTSGGEIAGRPAGYQVGTLLDPDADAETTYTFDDAGRIDTVADLDSSSFTYAYTDDSYHLPASLTGDSTEVSYTHESDRDALASIQNEETYGTDTTVSQYAYAVNDLGQRQSVVRTGSAHGSGSYTLYLYNGAGEMTDSETYGGTTPPSPHPDPLPSTGSLPDYHREYTFDAIGNRLEADEGTAGAVEYEPGAANGYAEVDEVEFTYDEDGNLLDDGSYDYTWDGENRLVALEPAGTPGGNALKYTATFDYLGRRVSKTSHVYIVSTWFEIRDETFLYDGWNLAATYWDSWGSGAYQRTYTWGRDLSGSLRGAGGVGGLLAAHEDGGPFDGDHFAFLYDGNGNVVQVVDQGDGSTAAEYDYGPFGQLVDLAPLGPSVTYSYALENPFRFSTKFADETYNPEPTVYGDQYRDLFYYYGYRSYDPQKGRWLNRDPARETGGVNLFGFLENKVTSAIDLLGLLVTTEKDFSGKKYGDWSFKQESLHERQATDTELNANDADLGDQDYFSRTWIVFIPNRICDCREMPFIQTITSKDSTTGENNPFRGALKGWQLDDNSGTGIDRGTGHNGWIFYGYKSKRWKGGLKDNSPGSRYLNDDVEQSSPAEFFDRPRHNDPLDVTFETCAVCKDGKDRGTVYGCITWGFSVEPYITKRGQVTSGTTNITNKEPIYHDTPSKSFRDSIAKFHDVRRNKGYQAFTIQP